MTDQNSTALPTVQQALVAVMRDVGAVRKTGRNNHQNFNFRGIDAVVNAVSPALQKAGVVVTPKLEKFERNTMQTSRGNAMNSVDVIVTYTFTGPAGDTIAATVPGEAFDSGDKATAKAMSVAFRTALLQALALPTDDADPDEESHNATPVGYGRPASNRQTQQGGYPQQYQGGRPQQAPRQYQGGHPQQGPGPQGHPQQGQGQAPRRDDLQTQINEYQQGGHPQQTGQAPPEAPDAEALNDRLKQAWHDPSQLKSLRIWAAKVPNLPEGYLAAIREREHALYQAQQ